MDDERKMIEDAGRRPRWPGVAPRYPRRAQDGLQDSSRWPKMLQDGSEDAPRGPKIAPKRLQEAKKLPKEAPKRPKSFKHLKDICFLPSRLFASDGRPRPQDGSKKARESKESNRILGICGIPRNLWNPSESLESLGISGITRNLWNP